jgi:hypothetical protein
MGRSTDWSTRWELTEAVVLAPATTVVGAGDEIRTHDPNLGKVVLYP